MPKKMNILPFYNKIVSLTRKYYFYNNFKLSDTFSSRINLIFFHLSFILIILRKKRVNKEFSQDIFDFFFKQIEINLRELGYADTSISKKMRLLIAMFYDILIKSMNWKYYEINKKKELLINYFEHNTENKILYNSLVDYFNKFTLFLEDISLNSLLKGVFNFDYKDK